jgi:hypothetical protein
MLLLIINQNALFIIQFLFPLFITDYFYLQYAILDHWP